MNIEADLQQAAKKIKMVVFDVDGVLTDSHIYMGNDGELLKAFSARDGMGITLLHKAGINTAIITGRRSEIVANRAGELKLTALWQGCSDKRQAYTELKEKFSLGDEEVAYVGDDLNDLPLIIQAGLGCAVGDAVPEVKDAASFVAKNNGGNGAVREIIEFILKAQGKWQPLINGFIGKTMVDDLAQ